MNAQNRIFNENLPSQVACIMQACIVQWESAKFMLKKNYKEIKQDAHVK